MRLVHEGQQVKVKLAAYPFQKYGMLRGKVTWLGADADDAQSGADSERAQPASTYKAIVTPQQQQLDAQGKRFDLTPRMQAVADSSG